MSFGLVSIGGAPAVAFESGYATRARRAGPEPIRSERTDAGASVRPGSLDAATREALDQARNRFERDGASFGRRVDGPAPGQAANRVSANSVVALSETRFDLNLTTAEGDAVTIRLRSEAFSGTESLRATGNGVRLAYDSTVRSSGLDLQVEIDGDLSRRELRQIRGLVSDVLRTGEKALRGGAEAFEGLAERGVRKSEIASYALDYRRTESRAATTYTQLGGPISVPFGLDPVTQPELAPVTTSSRPSLTSLSDSVVSALDQLAADAKALVEQARESLRTSDAPLLVRGLLDRTIESRLTTR